MTRVCTGLLMLLLCCMGLTAASCSATVSFGTRDGWCDCPDYGYRHKHDPWWYYEDYDRDGVINGRDAYPYDSWWW
jgi:hypothetical protein